MMSRLMLNLRDPKMTELYSGRTPQGAGPAEETTLPVVTSVFEHHSVVPTGKDDEDEDDELERDLYVPRPGEPESTITLGIV